MWARIYDRYVVRARCRMMLRRYVEDRPPAVAPVASDAVDVIDLTARELEHAGDAPPGSRGTTVRGDGLEPPTLAL